MENLLNDVIRGLPAGCIYGLIATGLVLVYKTSGVFNFAFAAQAYASAAMFYWTRKQHGWPLLPAFIVSVVILAPVLGAALEYLIFRHMQNAPTVVKLVVSLGLLTAIPELTKLWFGKERKLVPPSVAPNPDRVYYPFGGKKINITQGRLAAVIGALIIIALLTILFRYTALGLRMRAVVESPRMLELTGVNSTFVSRVAWMMSGLMAGLAGVLLAGSENDLKPDTFTLLLITATAAAAFGKLRSIPLTLAGGVILSIIGEQLIPRLLIDHKTAASYINPSFPFIMLFLLLLFWPGLRVSREATDPLSGVDPPPPPLAATERDARLDRITRILFPIFIAASMFVILVLLSDLWVFRLTEGVCLSIVFLSISLMTGLSGQLSLAQSVFAGFGAFTVGQLATKHDWPVVIAMLVGMGIAAAVGVLVALPSLRLGGLYLTLATFALALLANNTLYPQSWVGGGANGITIDRPSIGPLHFEGDHAYFIFCAVALTLCSYAFIFIRRGTTGRFLSAMRGSETAAAASGINPTKYKLMVFALSAAMAGLGGALLGSFQRFASTSEGVSYFSPFFGLVFVVVVVALGVRTVEGAINAGMSFVIMREYVLKLDWLHSLFKLLGFPEWKWLHLPDQLLLLGFGFAAITFARHPEGVIEANKRKSLRKQIERARWRAAHPVEWAHRLTRRAGIWFVLGLIVLGVNWLRPVRASVALPFGAAKVECGAAIRSYTAFSPNVTNLGIDESLVKPPCKDEARPRVIRGAIWFAVFSAIAGLLLSRAAKTRRKSPVADPPDPSASEGGSGGPPGADRSVDPALAGRAS